MRKILSGVGWQAGVIWFLATMQPRAMLLGILLGMVGHVAHVLAFLLPLKVILLAGSDGVPSYLRPFVAEDQKVLAIMALSIGAAGCYGLALFFEAIVKRQSLRGSAEILEMSNSISIINNQENEAQNVFLQFAQVGAHLLFVSMVLAFLLWLDPVLLLTLLTIIAGSFLYLASRAGATEQAEPPSRQHIGTILKILASLGFFICFMVILLPFVLAPGDANVLAAIISFVLVRQVLNVLPKVVRQSLALAANRPVVNALIFREHTYKQDEKEAARSFRSLFEKPGRVDRVRTELGARVTPDEELDVVWVDSGDRDFQTFEVHVRSPGTHRLYVERVVPPNRQHLADNEQFLFEHVSREALRAPPLAARFDVGRFDCLVSEIGEIGESSAPGQDALDDLLEYHWSLEPGEDLVEAYSASRPLLHARLTAPLIARVGVAVDDVEERRIFEAFTDLLPRVQETLQAIPLYVFNPHLTARHAYRRADGELLLTSWGHWSLEPLGAALPAQADTAELARRLERVRQARPSVSDTLSTEHLRLVHDAFHLERMIERSQYKLSLGKMSRILALPLFKEEGDAPASLEISEAAAG